MDTPKTVQFDLEPFIVEVGAAIPQWAAEAMESDALSPMPEPKPGDYGWGLDGVMVRKTGETFPLGSFMLKGDLLWRSI